MPSNSLLSTFLLMISLYGSVMFADYCSEQTLPQTIFNIGNNIYVNSRDKRLWLLNRNDQQFQDFTEINITQTFGDRYDRIIHGLLVNITDCVTGCEKLKDLVIVIGYDSTNKYIYSTFHYRNGELSKMSESDLPQDWGLKVEGDFNEKSHFWHIIYKDSHIIDFFSTSQTVFTRFRSIDNMLQYKIITNNGSIDEQWNAVTIKSTLPENKIGTSIFQFDDHFYDIFEVEDKNIRDIMISRKFKVNVTAGREPDEVELDVDPDFPMTPNKAFFKCSPISPTTPMQSNRTTNSTENASNSTDIYESEKSSESSKLSNSSAIDVTAESTSESSDKSSEDINPSDFSEIPESTTQSPEKSSFPIIIILIIIVIIVIVILICLLLWFNKKSNDKAENVKSTPGKPEIVSETTTEKTIRSEIGKSKISGSPKSSVSEMRSPSSISQRSMSGRSAASPPSRHSPPSGGSPPSA